MCLLRFNIAFENQKCLVNQTFHSVYYISRVENNVIQFPGHIFTSEKPHRSFFQGLGAKRFGEKNKKYLWGSILLSFLFGSDHQAEALLDNFT